MKKHLKGFSSHIQKAVLSRISNNRLFAEYYKRTDNRASFNRQAETMRAQEIEDWVTGVMQATDPINPRRGKLMRFYHNMMTDLHLASCIDNRILPIKCAKYKLTNANGDADTEAAKLLERPWFLELIRLVCLAEFEGTKLIELFDIAENGEIREIAEIPQSNFIPLSGIIVKNEWDNQGVSYKEGLYNQYYIQIGSNWQLGMFSQMAIIVLAKKLGLGSWMSYIDKYGVPPVFAITDRLDGARQKELFEMLQNFRMNHFAILEGNERIEVPAAQSASGHQSFTDLTSVCNDELSKRMLGGTGTSSDKSFVGSAEVHERLLILRNQVDKMRFKFYFNQEIKPRLVKLSPVYAVLENLNFEFDDKETLTLKELLETIKELSAYYDFDIDELVKITGLPITSIKNAVNQQPTPPDPSKKDKATAAMRFSTVALDHTRISAAYQLDKHTEKAAIGIRNGSLQPSDLQSDIVLSFYNSLSNSAKSAWGDEYYTNPQAATMRHNLMKFAGAKTYNMLSQFESLKANKEGEAEYMNKARSIAATHNTTYLNTERQYASASSSAIKDWNQFMEDADIYPNLKFRTMKDAAVRDEHAALEGLVKPLKQWTVTPPLGWKCRCWLEQTTEPTSATIADMKVEPFFANNVGLESEPFSSNHNYFTSMKKGDSTIVNNNTNVIKKQGDYISTIKTKEGNTVYINEFADVADLTQNIKISKQIADYLNKDIYILPHVHSTISIKNPELAISSIEELADLKTFNQNGNSKDVNSFLINGLSDCSNKKAKHAIIDISSAQIQDIEDNLIRRICGSVSYKVNKNIESIVFVYDNVFCSITRDEIISRDLVKVVALINKIKKGDK